tara:strand:- start:5073 stop:5312 length:240 start_codon:yes stop_codon:yes gene_type:complete
MLEKKIYTRTGIKRTTLKRKVSRMTPNVKVNYKTAYMEELLDKLKYESMVERRDLKIKQLKKENKKLKNMLRDLGNNND